MCFTRGPSNLEVDVVFPETCASFRKTRKIQIFAVLGVRVGEGLRKKNTTSGEVNSDLVGGTKVVW